MLSMTRSARMAALARTPRSVPSCRGSFPMRKTRPQRSRRSRPSSLPSSSFWIRVLISLSSTPVATRLGASALKRSLAGTTAPSERSATFLSESCRMRNCDLSWLWLPAASAAWKHASQKRRRVQSSG